MQSDKNEVLKTFQSNVLPALSGWVNCFTVAEDVISEQVRRRLHIYGKAVKTALNLLKPTGYVMHQQFNIQQLYVLPTHCIYVFCIYLRTNSDLCHLQHKVIGFYNRDEKCLLRGTNWVFK